MERFGKKGTKFIVEGRIQTGSYTDKNGNKVYTTDVVTENIEFAESKASAPAQQEEPKPMPNSDGFMNLSDLSDEELPFN
jgi:single-strand DNA-binding protein